MVKTCSGKLHMGAGKRWGGNRKGFLSKEWGSWESSLGTATFNVGLLSCFSFIDILLGVQQ